MVRGFLAPTQVCIQDPQTPHPCTKTSKASDRLLFVQPCVLLPWELLGFSIALLGCFHALHALLGAGAAVLLLVPLPLASPRVPLRFVLPCSVSEPLALRCPLRLQSLRPQHAPVPEIRSLRGKQLAFSHCKPGSV